MYTLNRENSKTYKYLRRHIVATLLALLVAFVTVVGGMHFTGIDYPQIEIFSENLTLRFIFSYLIFFIVGVLVSFTLLFPLLAKTVGKMFGLKAYKNSRYLVLVVVAALGLVAANYIATAFDRFFSFLIVFFFVYVFLLLLFALYLFMFVQMGKYFRVKNLAKK